MACVPCRGSEDESGPKVIAEKFGIGYLTDHLKRVKQAFLEGNQTMTKRILILASLSSAVVVLGATVSAADLTATNLRCEYLSNPLGIDVVQPRLNWIVESSQRGQKQTAYRILVASSEGQLKRDRGDLWNSGKVISNETVCAIYDGKPLTSQQRCYWKVKVWDKDGKESAWSAPARWSMGLLKPEDWKAKWIGLDGGEESESAVLAGAKWIWFPEGSPAANAPVRSRYFRRVLVIPEGRKIRRAVCTMTANNEFTLLVNGVSAGSGHDWKHPSAIDLRGHLHGGANTLAVTAINTNSTSTAPPGLCGAVQVEFAEGEPLVVGTDAQWETSQDGTTGWQAPQVLGDFGMQPWGRPADTMHPRLAARMLRREFRVEKNVRHATAYVCGLGLFELQVNGRKIGDHVLEPALTEYGKRVDYVTFDVTASLQRGANALGVLLGNGRFFAPRLNARTLTFGYPKLLLQMEIEYDDGSMAEVLSDEHWKLTTNGPIQANSEYDGEEYDARREMDGWSRAGFDDSAWQPAQLVSAPAGALAAQMIEPIRVTETIRPVAVTHPKPGIYIFDMGQNMVGWCRLAVRGPRGTTVRLRHAETLRPDGTLYLDNIRSAQVTDLYTLKGRGTETYEPRFTYHGFRYVEATGFPGQPTLKNLEGRVVHDAVPRAGEFACSNPLLNQIYHNIYWGTRGNYRSIPTDCPQRDERQGWAGDRSAESKGESYLFDIAALYGKWLADMADAQRDTGSIPDVAPSYWPLYNDGVVWPSSYIIIPHMLYGQYGDLRILQTHYDGMKQWTDYMTGFLKDSIMLTNTYGDWCVPPESQTLIHSKDPKRITDGALLSTAYFYYDLCLMARSARLLGKADDAQRFSELAEKVRAAFNRRFFKPETGWYDNGTQTSCVLPLAFGLVPGEHRARMFGHLVDKITNETQGHIGTGLIGGQYLMRVLSDNGRPDLAYTIASQKTYPGWGYMITKGATTMWELWNGDTADPAMNSGNHVMLIGDLNIWFHEYLAGVRPDPDSPGFKKIIIRPQPVGDLTWVKASYNSIRGVIVSDWKRNGDKFTLNVTIPANTTATIYVPAKDAASVTEAGLVRRSPGEGGKPVARSEGVRFLRMESGRAVFAVGGGRYSFVSGARLISCR